MSWLDKIKTELSITCGDGKTYKPQWLNAVNSVEYNVAEFNFSGVNGTLVKRYLPKGTKYNLQLFFTGENHLDVSNEFKASSEDSRAWTLTHPFYGRILVQPISLEFDNTKYNSTEVRGTVVETITENYPTSTIVPQEQIQILSDRTNDLVAQALGGTVSNYGIEPQTLTKQRSFINQLNANISNIISGADSVDAYYNAFNDALSSVSLLTSDASRSIRSVQSLINAPALFTSSVRARIDVLSSTLSTLLNTNINPILMDKYVAESNGNSLLCAICLSASLPQGNDYKNRPDVIEIIEWILQLYNDYLAYLDSIQTDNGGSPQSFIPDADGITSLSELINYTLGNLFDLAINSRQERTFALEKDSNWIVLAHRLYGLNVEDTTITELIEQNGAGLNEMLQVKKNRNIKYYI